MMTNYFNQHSTIEHFLFNDWKISLSGDFAIASIVFGVATFLLEGLKVWRESLHKQGHKDPLTYSMNERTVSETSPLLRSLILPPDPDHVKKRWFKYHLVATLINIVQLVLAYMIMLAVMSYNVWIFLAVTLGSGSGYFLFGIIRLHATGPSELPDQTDPTLEGFEQSFSSIT